MEKEKALQTENTVPSEQSKRKKRSREETSLWRRRKILGMVWPLFRFLLLFGLCFIILYPLMYMVSCAFRSQADMSDPTVMWLPRHFTPEIMRMTVKVMDYPKTLANTLLLNIGCSLVQVVSCAVTGYGFARFRFRGRKCLFAVVILQILVPAQILASPQYMEFRYCLGIQPLVEKAFGAQAGNAFNLIDSPLTMYLPAMTANGIRAGMMIFLFRQFFKGLPQELEDAACLDGCGPLRTFIQVMVPNAASVFLTVFLFSVVLYCNDYYVSSTFFTNNSTMALAVKNLRTLLSQELFHDATVQISDREQIIWMEAGCLLAVLPLLLMYAFLQRYFTEGIERSGLAG